MMTIAKNQVLMQPTPARSLLAVIPDFEQIAWSGLRACWLASSKAESKGLRIAKGQNLRHVDPFFASHLMLGMKCGLAHRQVATTRAAKDYEYWGDM